MRNPSWKGTARDLLEQPQACCCIGPQNGEPVCPCRMRNVIIKNGHYIQKETDLGEVLGTHLPSRERW